VYRSPVGWAVDAYSRFMHNNPTWMLPGRGKLCAVRLRSMADPVWIRLGSSDTAVVSEIAEHDEYSWILPYLEGSIETIVDLGGNCGITMRFWGEQIPSLKHIIVVEPDSDNMRAILRNSDAMKTRPILVEACVVARHRPVSLRRGKSATAFFMTEGCAGETLRTITIEDLVAYLPADSIIDLLKCDIEGAEQEVFQSCGQWIRRVRNMVVEIHGNYSGDHLKHDILRGSRNFVRVVESPYRTGVFGFFDS
jgi:FkbM family methyltransferase